MMGTVVVWIAIGIRCVLADPLEVDIKDFGFMAVVTEDVPIGHLKTQDHYRCAGLLISQKVVFTTCSCIGTFSFYRGVNVEFNPISFEVFQVVLGVESLFRYLVAVELNQNEKYPAIRIETVIPHQKCSWDRTFGYKFNWGAIVMEAAVAINKPLSLAPALLRETSSALETETLEGIIKEKTCYILGYGASGLIRQDRRQQYPLRLVEVKFITFMDCNRRVCLRATGRCLWNIHVANSGDMCLTAKNESDNCLVDVGSPVLCENKLTGIVTFRQNCPDHPSPLLAARLEGTVDFYYSLFGSAGALDLSRRILFLIFTILYRFN